MIVRSWRRRSSNAVYDGEIVELMMEATIWGRGDDCGNTSLEPAIKFQLCTIHPPTVLNTQHLHTCNLSY
jgi:hypothetical protein